MSIVKDMGSAFSALGNASLGIAGQVSGPGGIILGVLGASIGLAGDLMQSYDNPIEHITRIRSAETERAKVDAEVHTRIHGT